MGTRSRLALLAFTWILSSSPPNPLPGGSPSSEAARCPNCGSRNTERVVLQVFCRDEQDWFPIEPLDPENS
jgi:hypothetical protein